MNTHTWEESERAIVHHHHVSDEKYDRGSVASVVVTHQLLLIYLCIADFLPVTSILIPLALLVGQCMMSQATNLWAPFQHNNNYTNNKGEQKCQGWKNDGINHFVFLVVERHTRERKNGEKDERTTKIK